MMAQTRKSSVAPSIIAAWESPDSTLQVFYYVTVVTEEAVAEPLDWLGENSLILVAGDGSLYA